jgi:DNA-binding IclR family transcriptional regulator
MKTNGMGFCVNSLERMIVILDLFEGDRLEWTLEDMQARLGYTRSTLYRYLKVLTDTGLLTSLPEVGYTLGPRIAELDYSMRERDPLISASRPVMAELVSDLPGIALLCRRYRNRVLCVHQEQGTARPLFQGAASRIILAYLPSAQVRKIFESDEAAVRQAGLGENLNELRAHLRAMRQAGFDKTESQVTRGVTGVAAPIFDRRNNVLGSLSLTLGEDHLAPERLSQVAVRVMTCASIVTRAIARHTSDPLGESPQIMLARGGTSAG